MKGEERRVRGEIQPLQERTFEFALRVVKLCQILDNQGRTASTTSRQLLRAGTSIGANVEEGQASQSEADFLAKYSIACKEARETHYWLRLLSASAIYRRRPPSRSANRMQ
jgi:four helix bundle protein